jgi:asparagine synthase (glutamine-hydrolysing)
MSGIGGIYFLDRRPLEHHKLSIVSNALAHRGSDRDGIWLEESVGLCHRMLWTTPESLLETLPLVSQAGNLVITADARIDNRDELIPALGLEKYPKEKVTDSQIILAAYELWGENSPSRLIGDFAFAIWNQKEQSLFCARDPMGVKPFFYYLSRGIIVFASEIKAIISLAEVPCQVNELAVACFLENFFEDRVATFYKDIFRLPPSHCLTVSPTKQVITSYWSLDPSKEIKLNSNAEYAEAFREIFTEAVGCRLRSAFPVGSSLSGGMDSSSVACTARQLLIASGNSSKLHTFSAIFPSIPQPYLKQLDERKYIDAVVSLGDFEPHYIHADTISPLIDVEKRVWHKDEPTIGINMYLHWAMYQSAQEYGVRIFLDGLDGDTTVSHGLEYLRELALSLQWTNLIREAQGLARKYGLGTKKILWEHSFKPLVPQWVWQGLNLLKGRNIFEVLTVDLANPDLAERVELKKYAQSALKPNLKNIYQARKVHCRSMNSPLMTYALELADSCTNAFSLEGRYPFFDRRLMEFCLAIPAEQKLHQGMTRAVLHRAMQGILPPLVQSRHTKANLGANFQRNLIDCEQKRLESVVVNNPERIEPYINLSAIKESYNGYSSNPMASGKSSIQLLNSVSLNTWINHFKNLEKKHHFI